jgi:protein ImuB
VDALQLVGLKPCPLGAVEVSALAPEETLRPAGGARRADAALEALAERLGARLGGPGALVALARESHWPERAQRFAPALREPVGAQFTPSAARPPLLFKTPEPIVAIAPLPDGAPAQFRWRRVLHRVARACGPERIGAEWWRADGPSRDYYRVETQEGRRLWLFRLGLYGRESVEPGWFVHGCWP